MAERENSEAATTLGPAHQRSAESLCREMQIKLKPAGRKLLDSDCDVLTFYDRLKQQAMWGDARRVLAHALPRRRTLWWGCQCVWTTLGEETPSATWDVMAGVLRFVQHPSDEHRRAACSLAKGAVPNSMEQCLAWATFFSSGSLLKPELPVVAPKPFITARLTSVAVYLASVRHSAARYKEHLQQFLALGEQIARGENLWTEELDLALHVDRGGPRHALKGPHGLGAARRGAGSKRPTGAGPHDLLLPAAQAKREV